MQDDEKGVTSDAPQTSDELEVPTMEDSLSAVRKSRLDKHKARMNPDGEQPDGVVQSDDEEETQEEAEESTDEVEETDTEDESTEEGEDTEEPDDSVLSQINWDELSSDESAFIAEKIGSGAGKRITKLAGRVKELEKQLEQAEAVGTKSISKLVQSGNPYAEVTDVETLDTTESQIKEQVRKFQKWMQGYDDSYVEGENSYSREDVGRHIENLQAHLEFIPKQRSYINKLSEVGGEAEKYANKAAGEFDWFGDSDTDADKEYNKLVSDPDIKLIERVAPDLAAKLRYSLAHAANSISGLSLVKKKLSTKPTPKPQGMSSKNSNGESLRSGNKELDRLKKAMDNSTNNKEKLQIRRKIRELQLNKK